MLASRFLVCEDMGKQRFPTFVDCFGGAVKWERVHVEHRALEEMTDIVATGKHEQCESRGVGQLGPPSTLGLLLWSDQC